MQMGGILPQLEQNSPMSITFPLGDVVPDGWRAQDGTVGALIGVPMHDASGAPRDDTIHDTPMHPVKIVPITILHVAEIEACITGGGAARTALANDLLAKGYGHVTDLARPSLR